jgi:predicted transcriptional regulator
MTTPTLKLERTSIQLHPYDIARVKQLAEERGSSYSSIIRQAIREFLKEYEEKGK